VNREVFMLVYCNTIYVHMTNQEALPQNDSREVNANSQYKYCSIAMIMSSDFLLVFLQEGSIYWKIPPHLPPPSLGGNISRHNLGEKYDKGKRERGKM
jgi:hypothetical protein